MSYNWSQIFKILLLALLVLPVSAVVHAGDYADIAEKTEDAASKDAAAEDAAAEDTAKKDEEDKKAKEEK